MKNFQDYVDNGYILPTSVVISNGKETDIRDTCSTVQDFETFFQNTGMELRYGGMVTFEMETGRFMGAREIGPNQFEWEVLNEENLEPELDELYNKVGAIEDQIGRVRIDFH